MLRRRRDIVGSCLAGRRPRAGRRTGDHGLGIVEVVMAIALLAIVITPMVHIVLSTGSAANQDRLRVEAINLATQDLESYENAAYYDVFKTQTTSTPVTLKENGGKTSDSFTVTTTFQKVDERGGGSPCTAGPDAPQIWDVIVDVSWRNGGKPVHESTYVAPEQAGALPSTGGSLAIPIDTSAITSAPYTGDVPFVVVGTWVGGGTAPTPTGGLKTYDAGDTLDGCAVVDNLDADAGWQYQVYIGNGNGPSSPPTNQSAVVTSSELPVVVNGGIATSTLVPDLLSPISLTIGETTVAPPFYVAASVPAANVRFATYRCPAPYNVATCTDVSSTVPPAATLPVSVNANELGASVVTFDTAKVGAVPVGSISLFPYSDYGIWAGATTDSDPKYMVGTSVVYPNDARVGYDATGTPPATMPALPVYPLILANAKAPPGEALVAQEVSAPGESIPLFGFSGADSSTGLPLGQYRLVATAGLSVLTPLYVWVTPTGVYSSQTQMTTPSGTFTAAGSPLSVVL